MVDETPDLFDAQSQIAEAFTDKDVEALKALTPEERLKQLRARWTVYRHIDRIWDAPHLRSNGVHPNEAGGFEGVRALRDLLSDLIGNAERVQDEEGDDVDSYAVVVKVKHVDELEPGDINIADE